MKKYCLGLLLILITWNVQAHQPDLSSTMLVEKKDNKWILQIRSALTGFDYAIKAKFPNESEPYKTSEEFQTMVLKHLKENIQIHFNEGEIAMLQNGAIKLGHETSAAFEVVGVPTTIHSISVTNTSFEKINRNQSALIILKKGFKKKKYTLNTKNQHTMYLEVVDSQFVPAKTAALPTEGSINYSFYGGVLSFLGLLIVVFLHVKFIKFMFRA